MFDLHGKVALITGAASGIGEAIAHTFARQGAFVYVSDLDSEAGEKVTEQIRTDTGRAEFLKLDVSDDRACFETAAVVHRDQGQLDILVNNAGIGHVGNIQQTTADDLDRLYGVNIRGMFNLTKSFIPKMIERKHGVLLTIAGIGPCLPRGAIAPPRNRALGSGLGPENGGDPRHRRNGKKERSSNLILCF